MFERARLGAAIVRYGRAPTEANRQALLQRFEAHIGKPLAHCTAQERAVVQRLLDNPPRGTAN